jgi:hypothetical protein
LREECRLRVFENRVLSRIFESKKNEVTGEWRRLHDEEFNALYSSPNVIRVMKSRRLKWAGHVARMGESRILVGKSDSRRPLGRPTRRWEDNIKLNLREVGWVGTNWIDLAQNRNKCRDFVNVALNLVIP